MSLKKSLKTFLNTALVPFGIEVSRIHDRIILSGKYKNSVEEMAWVFNELVFPKFLPNPSRNKLILQLNGTGVSEGLYITYYVHKTINVKGDVCEFGIADGATSALIANEIKFTKKNLWLFDSFQGLSKPSKKDKLLNDILSLGTINNYEGSMKYSIDEVKRRLKGIQFPKKKTRIIPGFVEETLKLKNVPKKVSFAYLDMDLYTPTFTTLQFLDKRLSKNAVVIVDDYNFFTEGPKRAVDEFLSQKKKYKLIFPHKFAGYFCILEKL